VGYYRYDDRDDDFAARFGRSCRSRDGFAWGALLIGLLIGAIIF